MTDLITAAHRAGLNGLPWSQVQSAAREAWARGILEAHDGNASAAARDAHIHRNTIARMAHKER